MTESEHLLTCLAEECAEVAQRVTKALRFGLDEVQPEQSLTNADRILAELHDLRAVVEMLERHGDLPIANYYDAEKARMAKTHKVEHFMRYAVECGTLQPDSKEIA